MNNIHGRTGRQRAGRKPRPGVQTSRTADIRAELGKGRRTVAQIADAMRVTKDEVRPYLSQMIHRTQEVAAVPDVWPPQYELVNNVCLLAEVWK